ncbi:hypothetical protein TNCV_1421291 [Trichonephila clavipes]|nr:hypothetical protein TNCV_1421291 [Trichonephila clavipes]
MDLGSSDKNIEVHCCLIQETRSLVKYKQPYICSRFRGRNVPPPRKPNKLRPKSDVQRNPEKLHQTDRHTPGEPISNRDYIVSINTIRKKAHLLGFHGHAAAHKSLITNSSLISRLR